MTPNIVQFVHSMLIYLNCKTLLMNRDNTNWELMNTFKTKKSLFKLGKLI